MNVNIKIRTLLIACALLLTAVTGCKDKSTVDEYSSPSIIRGRVTSPEGAGLSEAFVNLADDNTYQGAFTDSEGYYNLDSIPSGRHRLRVSRLGYESYEAEVPSATNGKSFMNPVLKRKDMSVPSVKPLSQGMVRIKNRKLEVDFDGNGVYEQFYVKGAAYSPAPICSVNPSFAVHQRGVQYLRNMNANTVRTYSGADWDFLRLCAENNIRVIVGFWVDYSLDLTTAAARQQVKNDFGAMVQRLKDSPGVLMWNIGNEQNYQNGSNISWYTLVQELAVLAYQIEGDKYHPVVCSNGSIYNIGSAAYNADDASLTYMDAWASNAYEMDFTTLLANFRLKTAKPIVFTEFGIDAFDNRVQAVYESVQALHDSLNWQQILKASDVCIGGTVFEFTDEWWKDTDPCSHNNGGYPTGAHEDGYSNEEWWGLIAVTPDANKDGFDEWRPRPVFYMFQRNWK